MNGEKMVIDNRGYRLGVGIIISNQDGKLFWGRRYGRKGAWQFPQGGVFPYETVEETMFRELREEVGLLPSDVEILGVGRKWLYYQLPLNMRRHFQLPLCIGQKQRWFLLRLVSEDNKICLDQPSPEFDMWHWVDYWYPAHHVIFFKRQIYMCALKEFSHLIVKSPNSHRY